jgi:probable HAF family extracellular repeat protein
MRRLFWFFARNLRLQFVVASAVIAAGLGHAQQYSVTDLGALTELPGLNRATVNAINHQGWIAATRLTNDAYLAFLYTGDWIDLGTLGGSSSAALGLDASGRVVGRSLNTNGVNRAFLWTPDGTNGVAGNPQMQDLGTLGGTASQADDINSNGQIGGYSRTPAGDDHAMRFSGTMVDIHTLGNNPRHSYGAGINDAGHVTGSTYNNAFNTSSVFRYNGSSMINLGSFGWANADGLAINNNGQIVGFVSDNSGGSAQAFRYSDGRMTNLGTLGGNYSYGLAINNSNVVVGGSFTNTNATVYHAFICVSNTMVDLNELLDETGAGWELTEARAINDLGQIVGVGFLNGEKHAYLLNYSAPRITSFGLDHSGVIIEFTSFAGGDYFLQSRTSLVSGDWSTLLGNISGNPGMTTVTNPAAATELEGFFRIGLTVP